MSTKSSKFSGIFAQARERETAASPDAPADEATPIAAEPVAEEPATLTQNASASAPAGSDTSAAADAKQKASGAARSDGEVDTLRLADNSADASPRPAMGRPRGKRSDPNFTQITAYISKNTHQRVKMALLNEGQKREISELIEDQLAAWLARNG